MPPDFSVRTIDILSRRAALRCSNPDCGKLTTGPNTVDMKATNIGEGAHIYGARPGAARFRVEMTNEERAFITNAIWLCSDCHGLIDKDPPRYSSELLLLWKEKHEAAVLSEIGKVGDQFRRIVLDREMASIGPLPPYAEELVRQRPSHWEYLLSAELLDHYLKPAMRRSRDIELGLVTKQRRMLARTDISDWLNNKPAELLQVPKAIKGIIAELKVAWGAAGESGDPALINHVCKLFGAAAEHLVAIADDALFTALPSQFSTVAELLAEGALYPLREMPEMPKFLRSLFSDGTPTGTHHFQLEFRLPDGWGDRFSVALEKAYADFHPHD